MKFNRKIEALLASGQTWHVAIDWAAGELSNYLCEVALASKDRSGVVAKDIKARRKKSRSNFYHLDSMEVGDISEIGEGGGIAVHRLNGTMRMNGGLSSRGIASQIESIEQADASPSIVGHVFKVNSGGGESLAGNAYSQAVKSLKKPTVAVVDYMASAALNAMLHADKIFMNGKGSEAGSIGSYIALSKSFLKRYKEDALTIYSKSSPNKNNEFRELLKGNLEPMLEHATESADLFRSSVDDARDLNPIFKSETLAGGMFYAESAIERGLADDFGSFSDAVEFIRSKTSDIVVTDEEETDEEGDEVEEAKRRENLIRQDIVKQAVRNS